jgi:DNA-binding IclR family transcriptional regulator
MSRKISHELKPIVVQCEIMTSKPAAESGRRPSGVLVLHKMLDILETIREGRSGLSLTDLARALALPKPTAYRIVATLESRGYVSRTPEGHYQMSRKFFDLQQSESLEQILVRVAHPVMQRLVDSCRETVNLGVADAGEVVVISTIESPQAIRMTSKIGNRRYLHATALGKVLLCGMPEKEIKRLLRIHGLRRLTPNTITTHRHLAEEIERVRAEGYAIDNEENEPGGRCLGAPIVGEGGRIVAALSISAPIFRMDMTLARSLAGRLMEACRVISTALEERKG